MLIGFSGFSQCKIEKTFDKFEKIQSYQTEVISFLKGGKGFQAIFTKRRNDAGCSYIISVFNVGEGCRTDKSYIQFLTDKAKAIKINYTLEIDCSNSIVHFLLTEDQIKEIQQSTITDVRIVFENAYDIQLTDKLRQKLSDGLKCVIEAQ